MKRIFKTLLLVLLLALLAARLALPFIAKRKINQTLAGLEGYRGRVERVGMSLILGRFTLHSLKIWDTKKDFGLDVERLSADLAWAPLLRGALVADVLVVEPSVRLVAPKPVEGAKKTVEKGRKAQANVEQKTGMSLEQILTGLMPFRVNRLEIKSGSFALAEGAADAKEEKQKKDAEQRPHEPMRIRDIDIVVVGLTNASKGQAARATAKAELAGGTMELKLKLNPMADTPTFDLDAAVRDLDLAKLSPMLRWQWNVDVERGTFELLAEAKAADGAFKGYVKPFIKDFKAAPPEGAGAVKKVKQAVVGAVAHVLKNDKTQEIATKVPFEGRFDNPKTGVWEAVITVLRNAFVEALSPTFDKI